MFDIVGLKSHLLIFKKIHLESMTNENMYHIKA